MTAMAKVRLLAVLTMDGCPAETTGLSGRWLGSDQYGTTGLSGRWLGSDQYGIGALKEAATCVLTEDTSLTLLSNRMENTGDSLNYLIEATEKTAGIPELSDRSNRKDGRYHQRHDTDAACG